MCALFFSKNVEMSYCDSSSVLLLLKKLIFACVLYNNGQEKSILEYKLEMAGIAEILVAVLKGSSDKRQYDKKQHDKRQYDKRQQDKRQHDKKQHAKRQQ